MIHEVTVLCNCPDIEACRLELYISDVRIARHQIEMQQRALQLIADVSRAFVTVAEIMRRKRRPG